MFILFLLLNKLGFNTVVLYEEMFFFGISAITTVCISDSLIDLLYSTLYLRGSANATSTNRSSMESSIW